MARWASRGLLLGQRASLMLSSTRALPARLQEAGFQWQFPALEDALREIVSKDAEI